QVVHTIATVNGISMDSIAFRHAVSLLNDLHICSSTRALPGREGGWTIWLTADGEAPEGRDDESSPAALALAEAPWIKRRLVPEDLVLDAIVEAILSDPGKGGGFSLVHGVRARVCHALGVHDWVFTTVLRKALDHLLAHPGYDLHVDAGRGDRLPSSEEP